MTTARELVERDIGRMVVRIDTLLARVEELEIENDRLTKQLADVTEVHANGG